MQAEFYFEFHLLTLFEGGITCDDVVNYEVVLNNSQIVSADAQ